MTRLLLFSFFLFGLALVSGWVMDDSSSSSSDEDDLDPRMFPFFDWFLPAGGNSRLPPPQGRPRPRPTIINTPDNVDYVWDTSGCPVKKGPPYDFSLCLGKKVPKIRGRTFSLLNNIFGSFYPPISNPPMRPLLPRPMPRPPTIIPTPDNVSWEWDRSVCRPQTGPIHNFALCKGRKVPKIRGGGSVGKLPRRID